MAKALKLGTLTGVFTPTLLTIWAASKVTEADQANVRAWKPHLLVPFEDPERLWGASACCCTWPAPRSARGCSG